MMVNQPMLPLFCRLYTTWLRVLETFCSRAIHKENIQKMLVEPACGPLCVSPHTCCT